MVIKEIKNKTKLVVSPFAAGVYDAVMILVISIAVTFLLDFTGIQRIEGFLNFSQICVAVGVFLLTFYSQLKNQCKGNPPDEVEEAEEKKFKSCLNPNQEETNKNKSFDMCIPHLHFSNPVIVNRIEAFLIRRA